MIIDLDKIFRNTNPSGNAIIHVALNQEGGLQPLVNVPLRFEDQTLLCNLLESEKLEWSDIHTQYGTDYLLLYREGPRPVPSVMIWKYIQKDSENLIVDMGKEDIAIILTYVVEVYLKDNTSYGYDDWREKTEPRRLILDDGELHFEMEIADWFPLIWDDYELAGYSWCTVDMPLKTHYLDYNCGGEVFEREDIIDIRDALGSLLDRTMEKESSMGFVEPDIELIFSPEWTDYSTPGRVWYKEGSRTYPPSLKIHVNFWAKEGGLSCGSYEYIFNETEIKTIHTYLRYVTQVIQENDEEFQALVRKGVIL